MANLNNGASGKGNPGHRHDGQKDYQNSNQRNPDNVRNSTRDHRYKEHDETATNDANFENGKPTVDLQLDDKDQNVES
ncbi:MAG: hypothetical protein M0D53_00130 [Flavobacterium sp. JAD_PAG50586_2]|nr:MAG: hypothetical protein M0D53_00130 [Flavobacterium sp. JAD_PAG50586_2]